MRLTRRLTTAIVLTLLVASSCSGSDSENVVPLDAPAPGTLYVSTVDGALQTLAAAGAGPAATVVVPASQGAVVDVGPAPGGDG